MRLKEWIIWSTGKHARPIDKLRADIDYTMEMVDHKFPQEATQKEWLRRNALRQIMQDRLLAEKRIQVSREEFVDTTPMRSFKFLIRGKKGGHKGSRRIAILPPMTRFFDLHNEPNVEQGSLQGGAWMWVQPEILERTGYIFQGESAASNGLIPIPMQTPELQEMGHLLVALDSYLERFGS